ncbi:MAG: aspartate aminotransferase family protein [Chloroflexi bacterium]|nr:MAG: aspartate aminotransferase family protein [Chloroflexota bacterium]
MDHILKCHEIIRNNFVRGENCYLYDDLGGRYIDFESGIWCTALGHNHPRITRVIENQVHDIMHLGTRYPNQKVDEAAVEVLDIVGLEGKCVFLSSGSEAVEFGAQIIRRVTKKKWLLTLSNSYLAAYGSAGSKNPEEWYQFDWSTQENSASTRKLDEIPFDQIGGFVFEPGGSGSAFVKFPPKSLVQNIVNRIQQSGGLVAVNEVTTGMGRTGKWFGFQYYDIQPDIVSIGKGLGNGYPVSAIAIKSEIAERFEKNDFHYAQSHQNDPLGCAVAKEVIKIMREESLIERGAEVGRFFLESLIKMTSQYPIVKEARGRGMLLAVEFQPHENFSAVTAFRELYKNRFLVGYYPSGNILRFDPALTMEKENIQQLVDCLEDILKTVTC